MQTCMLLLKVIFLKKAIWPLASSCKSLQVKMPNNLPRAVAGANLLKQSCKLTTRLLPGLLLIVSGNGTLVKPLSARPETSEPWEKNLPTRNF